MGFLSRIFLWVEIRLIFIDVLLNISLKCCFSFLVCICRWCLVMKLICIVWMSWLILFIKKFILFFLVYWILIFFNNLGLFGLICLNVVDNLISGCESNWYIVIYIVSVSVIEISIIFYMLLCVLLIVRFCINILLGYINNLFIMLEFRKGCGRVNVIGELDRFFSDVFVMILFLLWIFVVSIKLFICKLVRIFWVSLILFI